MGNVLQAQGKPEAARAASAESLKILRRLTEQDPSNAGWQRDLAVAHSLGGDSLQAQGKLEAAQASFGESLVILRQLAEQDPSNARWQSDLLVTDRKIGDLFRVQHKDEATQRAYAENLAISRRLAERDPSDAEWQEDLAAHRGVGDACEVQNTLKPAQATLTISHGGVRFLDKPMKLYCMCCGKQATISLAQAAWQGWTDFEVDTHGMFTAACPDCAAGDS